ncbi:MAG: NapC/NirT family cytochrome c [Actinobacteria bacterium]|nr:NapC/NirT family cytochrome c [Actinomycetota bacterium]MBU1494382.1 NapC/NirT family cytochrome c [Actinomycetota bacterium]
MKAQRTHVWRGWRLVVLGCGAAAAALVLVVTTGSASAQEEQAPQFDSEYCLGCHANPGMQTTLPSGEVLDLTFDVAAHEASVHGPYDIPCVLCHTDVTGFPHEPLDVADLRVWTLERNQSCANCHEDEAESARDNVHAAALATGVREAAVCTDCHDAHNARKPVAHTPEVAETCGECHGEIYQLYEGSVHGEALATGNRDVPTCTDCHGVHDVGGPSQSEFHLFSPQICAGCHQDKELMDRYGVRADTFDTYIADFHGETVVLFEALAPGQETNKPVCIDCHGVHNIQSADNPDSQTFKDNILGTCQRCHPDASINFPSAWLGHYTPSADNALLVWLAGWFYKIVIPVTIGGMLGYVVLLSFRSRRSRKEAARG